MKSHYQWLVSATTAQEDGAEQSQSGQSDERHEGGAEGDDAGARQTGAKRKRDEGEGAAEQAGGIRGAMRAVWRGVQTAATAVTGWFGGGKRRREDDDDKDDAARPKAKAKIGDG